MDERAGDNGEAETAAVSQAAATAGGASSTAAGPLEMRAWRWDAGEGVTPMPDSFFASVRDHVIAFFAQLPDRVLLPVLEWINENFRAIVALASLVVAVLAFLSSRKTSRAQREHNQLSVRPLLNIVFGNYDTNLFVSLVNNGTGPMVIKSITVIGAANPSEPLIKAMPDLPPDDLVTFRYFASDPIERSIRAAGGEIILLQLRYNGEKVFKNRFDFPRDTIRAALGPLKLRVEYADIYEKRFVTERSLGYFNEPPVRDRPRRRYDR